jgi:hypothetical protein
MRLDSQFIQSPSGQLIVVGFIAVVATGVVAWQRNHRRPAPLPLSRTAAPAALPRVIQRPAVRFEQPAASTVVPSAVSASISSTLSAPPKVLPLSVVTGRVSPDPSGVIQSAPFGRLIPCETVVAIESNRLATPVIGLVTEDVWENGVLIVPAGAEVHGRAALDRARERIAVEGTWTVVCGLRAALWRVSFVRRGWRSSDAATLGARLVPTWMAPAGLRGQVIRTDDARELRLFASAFLSSATTALQEQPNIHRAAGRIQCAARHYP